MLEGAHLEIACLMPYRHRLGTLWGITGNVGGQGFLGRGANARRVSPCCNCVHSPREYSGHTFSSWDDQVFFPPDL